MNEAVMAIVNAVCQAADPGPMVKRAIDRLGIGAQPHANFDVLAVGKAADAMALAARESLGTRAARKLILTPTPSLQSTVCCGQKITRLLVDHPLPSQRNIDAAQQARAFVMHANAEDPLLVLLSGGASAALCLPRKPLLLDDIAAVTDALLRAGATINELNTVRTHLERLKGGGLVRCAANRKVYTLILSDVIGDSLGVIGSGPTAADRSTFADALEVLARHKTSRVFPRAVRVLERGCAGEEPETIKPGDRVLEKVTNAIIGNNSVAVEAACQHARELGYCVRDHRTGIVGEASHIGKNLTTAALQARTHGTEKSCILWGGETTVHVGDAIGRGGPNLEIALAGAIKLENTAGVTLAAFATDGRDGPTDVAGAVVNHQTCAKIRAAGIDPERALRTHDSLPALDAAGACIRTGPTGTNINDIMFALIESPNSVA